MADSVERTADIVADMRRGAQDLVEKKMDFNAKTTSELFQMIEESPEQFARNIQKSSSYGWKMSVSAYLDQLLEQYKMSIPDFIAKTYLSKSFVYQIFSGERNPGRDILLRIAFAMNLTLDETQELLMMGQKGALYPKVRRDAALICCLEQRLSLDETDEFLKSISEKTLVK